MLATPRLPPQPAKAVGATAVDAQALGDRLSSLRTFQPPERSSAAGGYCDEVQTQRTTSSTSREHVPWFMDPALKGRGGLPAAATAQREIAKDASTVRNLKQAVRQVSNKLLDAIHAAEAALDDVQGFEQAVQAGPPPVDQRNDAIVDDIMFLADQGNRNASLAKVEVQAYLTGSPYEGFANWLLDSRVWPRYDENRSGTLERDELAQAWADFAGNSQSSRLSNSRSEHQARVQRLIDARVLGRLGSSVAELHKVSGEIHSVLGTSMDKPVRSRSRAVPAPKVPNAHVRRMAGTLAQCLHFICAQRTFSAWRGFASHRWHQNMQHRDEDAKFARVALFFLAWRSKAADQAVVKAGMAETERTKLVAQRFLDRRTLVEASALLKQVVRAWQLVEDGSRENATWMDAMTKVVEELRKENAELVQSLQDQPRRILEIMAQDPKQDAQRLVETGPHDVVPPEASLIQIQDVSPLWKPKSEAMSEASFCETWAGTAPCASLPSHASPEPEDELCEEPDELDRSRALDQCFDQLDVNGDGVITREELRHGLANGLLDELQVSISPTLEHKQEIGYPRALLQGQHPKQVMAELSSVQASATPIYREQFAERRSNGRRRWDASEPAGWAAVKSLVPGDRLDADDYLD